MAIVLIVIAVVIAIAVLLALRSRSVNSSVDSFRRHIDALGPEARRNVVDQVQSAAGRDAPDPTDSTDDATPDATGDDAGEGGPRGT
jgi:hypothetical protein